MDPLPGNPTALALRAEGLSASAQAIQEAAEALFSLSFGGSGEALEVIAERADELAHTVRAAHDRYDGTAVALATYAVDLQAAHTKANDAISDDQEGQRHVANAEARMSALRQQREIIEAADPQDYRLAVIDDQIRDFAAIRNRFELQQHTAGTQRASAQRDLDEAAERAITRINAALADTNDGFWDAVGDFFANIGDFLDAIAQ